MAEKDSGGAGDQHDTTFTKTRPAVPALTSGQGERSLPYLVVLAGVSAGEMFKVDADRVVIGRAPHVGIRLADDGVSREHAAVLRVGGRIVLEDLGSTNGTFCNGVRVAKRELSDGDKIMIGSTTILKFTYQDRLEEVFQRQMYESALRDSLTKLFNRKHFNDLLEKEFAYAIRHNAPLSLLFVDVDHFKKINDTFGHPAGDFVLAEVSSILASIIRSEDIIARFGGEEFCVLCRGTDTDGARLLAERLRREVAERRFVYGGKIIPVTVSVGAAVMPDPTITQYSLLLAAADKALYEAKRSGRNRVVLSR